MLFIRNTLAASHSHTYKISHTGAAECIRRFPLDNKKFLRGLNIFFTFIPHARIQTSSLVIARDDAPFMLTPGYQHQHGRAICHFALIVSLQPGHNVSIKSLSIEKSFLVFSFKLQHAFMRSAVFHVEWPVLMQTQSLGIQAGSTSARRGGSQGKE